MIQDDSSADKAETPTPQYTAVGEGAHSGKANQLPGSSPENLRPLLPYALAIFLSAFLLFQVEPIIARYILPWFGGSPAVWTTCMLFFQVMLLGGYVYAHLLARHPAPRYQALFHLSLVSVSLLFLPITPGATLKPDGSEDPLLAIIFLLVVTIGVPFLLVSASGPLLQYWFSRVHPTRSPYRLFALSNLGSLLGLVSYPFFIEPQLGLGTQTILWSAGYGLYALMCVWGAVPFFRIVEPNRAPVNRKDAPSPKPSPRRNFLILALATCGSVVLLASTNQLCRDIAVVPFLWVLPLSLYLISFILSFDHPRWYQRWFWVPVLLISLSAVVYLMLQDYAETEMNVYFQISIYSAGLFACCMTCHGELARLKPHAAYLTSFYLLVASGGALGGILVSLIAPLLFKGFWEFHLSLIATLVLLGICLFRTREFSRSPHLLWTGRILWIGGVVLLAWFLTRQIHEEQASTILTQRNFYGVLRVKETDLGTQYATRLLYHGRISHGKQLLTPGNSTYPTAYYGPFSGISVAIGRHPQQLRLNKLEDRGKQEGLHVGNIGLGVGTIAAYSRPGDTYRFYEINPDVERLAEEHFTFLREAKGTHQIVLGDGRISLERKLSDHTGRPFDILSLDAFSGDGIPVHLLTREAFALYWALLQPDGILAIHITNRHFDLTPVIRALAGEFGKNALWIRDMAYPEKGNNYSEWVLVTNNQTFLKDPFVNFRIAPWSTPQKILWTDDYSNLFQVVRP